MGPSHPRHELQPSPLEQQPKGTAGFEEGSLGGRGLRAGAGARRGGGGPQAKVWAGGQYPPLPWDMAWSFGKQLGPVSLDLSGHCQLGAACG